MASGAIIAWIKWGLLLIGFVTFSTGEDFIILVKSPRLQTSQSQGKTCYSQCTKWPYGQVPLELIYVYTHHPGMLY